MKDLKRFERAIAAIDAVNAQDPQPLTVRGIHGPKEVVHSRLVTEWVRKLASDPSEALLLAARLHHIRRWEVPRSSEPPGRAGYLRWRESLLDFHAQVSAEILAAEGYADDEIDAVARLVRKADLRSDAQAQTLEDALCLVFLETQAADFALKEPAKVRRVLAQTLRKMSAAGRDATRGLSLDESVGTLLLESLAKL